MDVYPLLYTLVRLPILTSDLRAADRGADLPRAHTRLVCFDWAAELFAIHPEHGTARIDACGALMLGNAPPLGVETDRVLFERNSGYRNKPGQVCGVPVWEFARGGKDR